VRRFVLTSDNSLLIERIVSLDHCPKIKQGENKEKTRRKQGENKEKTRVLGWGGGSVILEA
jgi:hypothetical protein